ncbi:unnamed protein product, partial [Nesidiocoris tenuis]
WPECGGDRLQLYNHSCYLFVSYPEVTWHTANEICRGQKGEVASVHSAAEERFIVRKIRESREYSTSAVYWLGAKSNSTSFRWAWSDKTPLDFTGWVSASKESHGGAPVSNEGERCLGLQWMGSPTPLLPSSLYWSAQPCDMVGGYVCKKHNPDPIFKSKLIHKDVLQPLVESCTPSPCQNGGKCVTSSLTGKHSCQCVDHFTGMMCGLTLCDLQPCLFGECMLTKTKFKCACKAGYKGDTCEERIRPCSSNPCDSHGECIENSDATFRCQCYAWWDDISNRHCPSVRERTLAVSTTRDGLALAAAGGGGSGGSGNRAGPEPKTLLGRLGIRKPSLLSTPSLQPPAAHFHSRTFSLDDLITGSTSPSPRKKRNNSTPTKKSSASEKKQILQQLVSPALNAQESIPLSSNSLSVEPSTSSAETSFTAKLTPDQSLKLEKKVTFARLLDKVSSEMSSGSEVDLGGPRKVTSSSADQLVNRHHSDRDHPVVKSPNSTSSNQGSDSRSSSETHLSIGTPSSRCMNLSMKLRGPRTSSDDFILISNGKNQPFQNDPGSSTSQGYVTIASNESRHSRPESRRSFTAQLHQSVPNAHLPRIAASHPTVALAATLQPSSVQTNAQDTEDHIPHSILRRPSPLIRAPSEDSDPQVSHHAGPGAPSLSSHRFAIRPRSDSETLSDDPQLESNDEGFGTDQLDEKIEEGEVKSAKELELFIEECNKNKPPSPTATVKHCSSFETGLEACRTKSQVKHCSSAEAGLDCFRVMPTLVRYDSKVSIFNLQLSRPKFLEHMLTLCIIELLQVRHSGSAEDALDSKRSRVSLQLPSILVEGEPHCEKHISPVSSRSESPLSDKTGE